jgi:prevent-host-death family protein
MMHISVTDAKAQLTELMRRAEAGEEVVLTRHGHAAVKLVPVKLDRSMDAWKVLLEDVSKSGAAKALPGPCAARSQDFLYDEDGLPA